MSGFSGFLLFAFKSLLEAAHSGMTRAVRTPTLGHSSHLSLQPCNSEVTPLCTLPRATAPSQVYLGAAIAIQQFIMPHTAVNFAEKQSGQVQTVEPFGFNNSLPFLLSPDFSTNCARIYHLWTVNYCRVTQPQEGDDILYMAAEQGLGLQHGGEPSALHGT